MTLLPGDEKTCTVTNSDVQPKLKLVKTVVNQYGGTATAADFEASVSDGNGSTKVAWDTFVGLNVGAYDANETGPEGYMASRWGGDCDGDGKITLASGDKKTCTITNTDVQPKLKLVKTVVNQFGGTATAANFQASVIDGTTSQNIAWDTFVGLKVGAFDANETHLAGYTASTWSGDCDGDGKITLKPGDEKTCTITNSDVQPTLKLVKTVVNQHGGTAIAADFKAAVTDGSGASTTVAWEAVTGLKAGAYTVSETERAGYATQGWGGDCAADGKITLAPGDTKTCTITNSDIQPKLKLVKTVENRYGGTAAASDFKALVTDAGRPTPKWRGTRSWG